MAISKITKAALKALSYPDIEIRKNYKLIRTFENTVKKGIPVPGVTISDSIIPFENHNINLKIFSCSQLRDNGILMFIHGGGWVSGSTESYETVCSNLSKITSRRVISIEYRLAPEHPFPAGLNDCYKVYSEIIKYSDILGIDKKKITLIGDSAGGNLCASLSLMLKEKNEFVPDKQILLYPVTYFKHNEESPFNSVHENGEDYLLTTKKMCDYMSLYIKSKKDLKNPYLAPLLSENLSGQPKTLVITAEYDLLRDEGEEYAKKLKEAGNYVENYRISDALHGFFCLSAKFNIVKETYKYINQFLDM